jgi:Uracil DNA glycosylase superfamily
MSNLVFCPFDDHQFEAICNLLCKTFNTSKTELLGFYKSLGEDFDKSEWPSPILAERSFFTAQDSQFHATYKDASVIACDLPSLLSKGGQHTVMIIAQDSYGTNPNEKVWIGTPYALHIRKCREKMQTRRYFQLIDVLLEQGYQTYLTDFYKVYVQGAKLPRKDRQRFAEILKQEIEIVKPTAIITWGNSATNAVRQLRLDRPHYAYLHPSGTARGAWAKLIGDRATDENILAYWRQSVSQQLSLMTLSS